MSELPIPVSGILNFADDDDWDQWRPAVAEAGIPVLEIAADEAKTQTVLVEGGEGERNTSSGAGGEHRPCARSDSVCPRRR